MFRASRLMIINKSNLLPYVTFDAERCIEYSRRVNPDVDVLVPPATTGEGMDAWLDWLRDMPDGPVHREAHAPHTGRAAC